MLVAVVDLHLLVLIRQSAEQLDGAEMRSGAILVAVDYADGCWSVGIRAGPAI